MTSEPGPAGRWPSRACPCRRTRSRSGSTRTVTSCSCTSSSTTSGRSPGCSGEREPLAAVRCGDRRAVLPLPGGRVARVPVRAAPRSGARQHHRQPLLPRARRGLRPLDLLRPRPRVHGRLVRGEPGVRPFPGTVGVTAKGVLIGVLLTGGALVELGCCLGLLVAPTLEDRLHFLTPASSVGPVLIAG